MSLTVELTKKGKPTIVFRNYKFRESHTLKTGETSWRCLGRTCTAKIKTNANRSEVIECSNIHSGHHPVTMRSMISPQPGLSPKNPTSSPAVHVSAPCSTVTPDQSAESPLCNTQSSPLNPHSLHASLSFQTPVTDLKGENTNLREQLSQLNEQFKCVLDHSIESDTRLLQFTDQVFVANTSLADQHLEQRGVECGVQCELPSVCRAEQCAEDRALICSLRTTIEVLEAELQCMKSEATNCECKSREGVWTIIDNKRLSPIKVQNKFECLINIPQETQVEQTFKKQDKKSKRKTRNKKTKIFTCSMSLRKNPLTETVTTTSSRSHPQTSSDRPSQFPFRSMVKKVTKSTTPFSTIEVHGDSHARNLAGLTRELVGAKCSVTGVCKPSARLLSVAPALSTQSDNPKCIVLIAGSNDVSVGEPRNIYRHLETVLTRYRNRRVVLSTLPFRHDLQPDDDINYEILCVNSHIKEVSARHPHVVVMDVNKISRRHFTRHGQHLGRRGKRMLARLMVSSLQSAASLNSTSLPPVPQLTDAPCLQDTSSEPITLPYDSYADAVKMSCSKENPSPSGGSTLMTSRPTPTPPTQTADTPAAEQPLQDTTVVANNTVFLGRPGHPRSH